jgi:hypothetical protein
MRKYDTWHTNQESEWQLLLQFIPPAGPAGEPQSVQRITEAMRELGLQPAEVKRIRKAVVETLREATRRGGQEQHDLAVLIQIWISRANAKDHWRSSPDAEPGDQSGYCAYGFFIIQRQEDDLQASAGNPHHVIELYLYQESASKRPNQTS